MLYFSSWSRFELTTSVVIGIDCIGSCKSNYHTIMTTTAPSWRLTNMTYWLLNYDRWQMMKKANWFWFKNTLHVASIRLWNMCNYCIIHNLEINIIENRKGQSRAMGNVGHKTRSQKKQKHNTESLKDEQHEPLVTSDVD